MTTDKERATLEACDVVDQCLARVAGILACLARTVPPGESRFALAAAERQVKAAILAMASLCYTPAAETPQRESLALH